MRDLGMPMDVFKEHIIGLQMCGEDHMFAELPTQSKSAFTKIYNQVNKSSIQATKKKKSSPTDKNLFSGATFDPEFMENPSDDNDSEDSDQESDVVATNVKGGAKASKAPKATKAAKSESKPAKAATKPARGGRGRGASRGRK